MSDLLPPPNMKHCTQCSAELPADGTNGLCPACLMAEAMKPTGPKLQWVPPTAEELHAVLPQYEIVKMLGRGGMGAVYMGRQTSLDRPVAIKILSAQLEDSDMGFKERFKNEARAMAKLNHPGIVSVYDFGETPDGLLFIVMEYVDGTDVARMMAKDGRMHTEHAMAITAHVCDALAYAHERGIIHRDIKPANIMVGYDGEVKVADFGLAKVNSGGTTLGLTQSGMAMGTLHYMAPESLMLGTSVDHRADIYAVGVMLYHMLTGKLPQGMFKMPSLLVPGLDPRYDGIIAKGIMEDREARYQSVGEMRRDLDGILTQPVAKVEAEVSQAPAALPTMARPQRPGDQTYRPPQSVAHAPMPKSSNGWLVWAVLGVLALGGGYFWLTSQPSNSGTSSEMTATSPKPVPPNPFEAVDPPDQPMLPAPVASVQAATAMQPSTVSVPTPAPSTPVFDLQQLPDFRIRIANYQKARHAKLSALTARYRTALTEAQSSAPADAAAYTSALTQAAALMTEIEKNLTTTEVKPLSGLAATTGPVPQRLKELRDIFEKETIQLETGLATDLDQSLSVVQTSLAHSRTLDAANAVAAYRQQLAAMTFIMAGSKQARVASGDSNAASSVLSATKDKPFVNSLGMKFVPVPGTKVLMCIHETRKGDYAAYAAENASVEASWKNVSFKGQIISADDAHPVVKVSWDDAQQFCAWLSRKSGQTCRLPTDAEWSIAVGSSRYPWGSALPPPAGAGNFGDETTGAKFAHLTEIEGYADGFVTTAPVMSFSPNPMGLYDLAGNVWEWCADLSDDPNKPRFFRGGSWIDANDRGLASVARYPQSSTFREDVGGFRVVIELPVVPAASVPLPSTASTSLPQATKVKPFVNSLGMKFVPVPGTKVLMCIHETRRRDYDAYATNTPGTNDEWKKETDEGFALNLGDDHPVTFVNKGDARGFCTWLSGREGHAYRLPTDREWSCAVGIGDQESKDAAPHELDKVLVDVYPWGSVWPPPNDAGNLPDSSLIAFFPRESVIEKRKDGFSGPAPVMSFPSNVLGLYDLAGNVWEWTGTPFQAKNGIGGLARGCSWRGSEKREQKTTCLSSHRQVGSPATRASRGGFRVVLELL